MKTFPVDNDNNEIRTGEIQSGGAATFRNASLIELYKKQFIFQNGSSFNNLALEMKGAEIGEYLITISEQLVDEAFSVDAIVESLRTKIVYMSESHFLSRNIFGKKRSSKFKEKCEWFDDECRKQKTLLNNVRKSYQKL